MCVYVATQNIFETGYIASWDPGLLAKIHVKIHVIKQDVSNRASDWLAAVLPANQKHGLSLVSQ